MVRVRPVWGDTLKLKIQELHNCPQINFNGKVYVQIGEGVFEQIM